MKLPDIIQAWEEVFTPEVQAELERKFAEVDALAASVKYCIGCGRPLEHAPPLVCPLCYLLEPR